MATIVLSAVGAAAGAAVGGNFLGLSSVVIGRALGATLGRWIDQQIMGGGSEVVESGKTERFRLTGASEGAPIAQVYGRVRTGGQVIWATKFKETVTTTTSESGGSGKGGSGGKTTTTEHAYSYSISLAVAICEGEITSIGRIWADGAEITRSDVAMRIYKGSRTQLPDPKIFAVEGATNAPAYRGVAYVVFEDLQLAQFGNRVPQFSFEVMRPEQPGQANPEPEIARQVRGVAMIPGTGEYSLATTPVYYDYGPGEKSAANLNSKSGVTDFSTSLTALNEELPNCGAVSLVVSWFGGDLFCGNCELQPKVEQTDYDGDEMPWSVSGLARVDATPIVQQDGRPVYGGTPCDRSVTEAIQSMSAQGKAVTFYPFILMDQQDGNGLLNPWTGQVGQPAFPWRGRITTSLAPGVVGSLDGTAAAAAEVAAFFGQAAAGDFSVTEAGVDYSGPAEWSYRRFILHYAHLCAASGGVGAFCIGSEMRALTQIRGANNSFPAVAALKQLAADVRGILGPNVKISYAADWSEYFGYQPADGSGDVFFHLDPLWADINIDFVGIDNYMPLSDWRDGPDHADAHRESIYNLEYLRDNIAGGEGYDWYYPDAGAEARQERHPIEDGAYGEPWIYRYKDLKNWWSRPHHDRIGGVRQPAPTAWLPQSKPIWFTELGCAAIDKGTNQPNKFLDPKSSESKLPKYSNGQRDDYIQMQYLRAMFGYWSNPQNNPTSIFYHAPMVDTSRAHVWAWDARPFPHFPANAELWSDGDNYTRGHWANGRTASRSLGGVVAEICARSGVTDVDVSRVHGLVRGYALAETGSARSALQPLMLAYGFDAVERCGVLSFKSRTGLVDALVSRDRLALLDELEHGVEATRAPEAEIAGRLRLAFTEADGDFEIATAEAVFPDEATHAVSHSDMPLVLTHGEGRSIVERWLAEARVARDSVKLALPPSKIATMAGDVIRVQTEAGHSDFRVDRVEQGGAQLLEAVRVDADVHAPQVLIEKAAKVKAAVAAQPVYPVFLDLPLLRGDEIEHAPHLAASARAWPGPAAVYSSAVDAGYVRNITLPQAAVMGTTLTPMHAAGAGTFDRGLPVRVKLITGDLASVAPEALLNGANAAAIGDPDTGVWEVFQFANANLSGERSYDLSMRLRGQAGTDAVMPAIWPEGSTFVLLNGALRQIEIAASDRGLERHYRIGPADKSYDNAAYVHVVKAFDGVGLRPLSPVHLRAQTGNGGEVDVTWIRRTRIDGDSWSSYDVPLGEASEQYVVRVLTGATVRRETIVQTPSWTYTAAAKNTDGVSGSYSIAVAQLSDRFGPGPFERIEIDG